MPMPLRPIGPARDDNGMSSPSGYFSLNPSQFDDLLNLSTPMIKEAAGDVEAGSLYELWQKSSVTKAADSIKDRIYDIPKEFDSNELMRLKTSGFLVKRDAGVAFTEKAERIIKTMILGEENALHKGSVKKPYSLILAESKTPKRSSGLTHTASARAEKKDVFRTAGLISLSMSENSEIPGGQEPDNNSVYIFDRRLISTKDGSWKEYNVRVYDNGDGTYDVWAWNGRTNGAMKAQPKGRYNNRDGAIEHADGICTEKKIGKSKYHSADIDGISMSNPSLPGVITGAKPVVKPKTTKKPEGLFRPMTEDEKAAQAKRVEDFEKRKKDQAMEREEKERIRQEKEKLRKEEEQVARIVDLMDLE